MPHPSTPLRVLVTATGTEIGKTWVVAGLVAGLRQLARPVWLWKPVACGGWQDHCAEDARLLMPLVSDGQDPASLCQHQWPEPASPHRAAAAAGDHLALQDLISEGMALQRGNHDLIVEGAGGLLSPLTSERATAADLAGGLNLALVIVTTPDLGTFHHTRAVVEAARHRQLAIAGLVVNHVRPISPSVATNAVAAELAEWCAVPLLAECRHAARDPQLTRSLAENLVEQQALSTE